MKKLILALICIGFSMQSLAKEACYNPSNTVQVVIDMKSDGRISSIEFYKNSKLIVRDLGESDEGFRRNICHLHGDYQIGKFFTYGGCGTSEEFTPKGLTFKNFSESYDLKKFSCYPMLSQVAKPPQSCCSPCQEVASPGSCGERPMCPHHGACH